LSSNNSPLFSPFPPSWQFLPSCDQHAADAQYVGRVESIRYHLSRHDVSAAPRRSTAIVPESSFRTSIASSTASRDCFLLSFRRHDLRLSLFTGGVASPSSCKSSAAYVDPIAFEVNGGRVLIVDTWVKSPLSVLHSESVERLAS
jgi:hypothetical protein